MASRLLNKMCNVRFDGSHLHTCLVSQNAICKNETTVVRNVFCLSINTNLHILRIKYKKNSCSQKLKSLAFLRFNCSLIVVIFVLLGEGIPPLPDTPA